MPLICDHPAINALRCNAQSGGGIAGMIGSGGTMGMLAEGSSTVTELTEETYADATRDDAWLVAFVAPWCGECHELKARRPTPGVAPGCAALHRVARAAFVTPRCGGTRAEGERTAPRRP